MKVDDKRQLRYTPDTFVADGNAPENYIAEDLSGKEFSHAQGEILQQAVRDVGNWYDYFSFSNETFRLDLNFIFMDQWDAKDRATRSANQKPTLMFNFLYTMITQLLGEQRQNTPNPLVRATKPNISQAEVTVRDDLLRKIFYDNNMDVVIQNAFMYALCAGYGAWVVELEYESPKEFQLKICTRELRDPRSAFWDPKAIKSDKSDGNYAGYFTEHTAQEFHMLFPKAKSDLSFSVRSNYSREDIRYWMVGKKVRVCHYWVKEYYEEDIVQLSTGESMTKDEAEEKIKLHKKLMALLKKHQKLGVQVPPELLQDVAIQKERTSPCYKIRHYKMVLDEILEVRDWPSTELPVVFLDCQSFFQDGLQVIQSFHKFAQDQQRFINYIGSEAAECMLNAQNGNWLGTPGNFKGKLMELWKNPQRSKGALIADYDQKGNLPQYTPPPKISTDFEAQFSLGLNNLNGLVGRYESNRGANGNEPSGKALGMRANLGNLASFVPFDNCKRSVAQTAKVMLSLFPAVYDSTMPIMVRSKDGKERTVMINQPSKDDQYINDMSKDHFDVTIEAGSNFAIQREAELAMLQQAMSLSPEIAKVLIDKYVGNLDVEDASQLVERIQDMMLGVPLAEIISKETGKPVAQQAPPPPDPRVMAIQQKAQQTQMEAQSKNRQQIIDEQKLQLQSQQMVQDAINNHANDVIEVEIMNKKLQADMIRAKAELERNHLNVKSDMAKHLLTMGHQQLLAHHKAGQIVKH